MWNTDVLLFVVHVQINQTNFISQQVDHVKLNLFEQALWFFNVHQNKLPAHDINISHIRPLLSKVHLDRSFVICNMIKQGNNSTTQNRKKCKEDLITHHGSPHVFVSVYTKTWIYIYVTKDCQHLFLTLNIMYYSQPECHYRGNYRLYIDENHLIMMDLKSYYID